MPRPGEAAREGSTTPSCPPQAGAGLPAAFLHPWPHHGAPAAEPRGGTGGSTLTAGTECRHPPPSTEPVAPKAPQPKEQRVRTPNAPESRAWIHGFMAEVFYPWSLWVQAPQKSSSYLCWWSPEVSSKEKGLLGAGRVFKGRASVLLSWPQQGRSTLATRQLPREQLPTVGHERGCKTGPRKCAASPSPKGR